MVVTKTLIAMLRRGLADVLYPIDVVVELTRGLGRDEEVIGLLRSQIDAGTQGLEGLLASVLERGGRVDEAVAVLSTLQPPFTHWIPFKGSCLGTIGNG